MRSENVYKTRSSLKQSGLTLRDFCLEEIVRHLSGGGAQQREALSFGDFAKIFLGEVGRYEQIAPAPHVAAWAEVLEKERFVALIAFRGSLKSTVLKALIGYKLYTHERGAFDAVYYSSKLDLARWHLRRLKLYLEHLFGAWGWRDATAGEALVRYEKAGALFTCEPEGLDAASRGRRADLLVIDDPCDPRKLSSIADLGRTLENLQRRIIPLLKDKNARVVLAATPIIEGDVVSWVQSNPEFATVSLPALDERGHPTWPQKYPTQELEKIKRLVGERAFAAEYLLQAVAPTDSFVSRDLLMRAITIPAASS